MTTPYNAPDYAGNKPAGYLISCTKDMAQWMGIQMGIVKDIPEIFRAVIEKLHQGDRSVPAVKNRYYAAGWSVNADQTVIEQMWYCSIVGSVLSLRITQEENE